MKQKKIDLIKINLQNKCGQKNINDKFQISFFLFEGLNELNVKKLFNFFAISMRRVIQRNIFFSKVYIFHSMNQNDHCHVHIYHFHLIKINFNSILYPVF